jgi:regulator of protease activity HflC (stomatin/prohibitin superfamily)
MRNNDEASLARLRQLRLPALLAGSVLPLLLLVPVAGYVAYTWSRVYVPAKHIAVMTKKTGKDLANDQEVAPDQSFKGIQLEILTEGRHFRNPYTWDWSVYPMVEVPENRMGVRIRLYGEDLGYGEFVARDETYKGIVADELPPGRYPINAMVIDTVTQQVVQERPRNDHVEIVELHSPVTIPAGYKGVVTNLSGPIPSDPNQLLVEDGFRGVQRKTLDEGTYYLNPYTYRIELIDCRSQRFNLAEGFDMGFPSKDGFWVSLDGVIEFRVKPELAAQVYVTYNETENDDGETHDIDKEIIRKVIMPNARSFCRLQGANSSGRDFIGGETRTAFQTGFQNAIRRTCEDQGIEIVQALITKINPPQAIAGPVRDRDVAAQQLKQYNQQRLQQDQEAKLATEVALVSQRQQLVESQREVIKLTTDAQKRQEVALAEANRDKDVAAEQLAAAKDMAAAILAEKSAEAKVIEYENEADAAGWKRAVEALGGDGSAYARYVMYQKLAPGYRSIMTNTADSPLMNVFRNMSDSRDEKRDEKNNNESATDRSTVPGNQ